MRTFPHSQGLSQQFSLSLLPRMPTWRAQASSESKTSGFAKEICCLLGPQTRPRQAQLQLWGPRGWLLLLHLQCFSFTSGSDFGHCRGHECLCSYWHIYGHPVLTLLGVIAAVPTASSSGRLLETAQQMLGVHKKLHCLRTQ